MVLGCFKCSYDSKMLAQCCDNSRVVCVYAELSFLLKCDRVEFCGGPGVVTGLLMGAGL